MHYMLISEGKDDRMLLGPIDWLLGQHCSVEYSGDWANPAALEDSSRELSVRLSQVGRFYPCDLAFVHRDTDTFTYEDRHTEITAALVRSGYGVPVICAIPVRMTEAWFLFDAAAIRRAADKPRSVTQLNLPNHTEAQRRADPKRILEDALVVASELSGRKLDQFKKDIGRRKALVSNHIDDYSSLRAQSAFLKFESDLRRVLLENFW